MNKRKIIASLNNIANTLDNSGLYKEANTITKVMVRIADEFNMSDKFNMGDEPLDEPLDEPATKPMMKPKSKFNSKPKPMSTYLEKVTKEFEQKVIEICSNTKDASLAMESVQKEYFISLVNIIDYSREDRPKFYKIAMDIINDNFKKYNLFK
jgi:hypothetical protein